MGTRRRITADFEAKEALRGNRAILQIRARHKVHPTLVSTWKRQAMTTLSPLRKTPAWQGRCVAFDANHTGLRKGALTQTLPEDLVDPIQLALHGNDDQAVGAGVK